MKTIIQNHIELYGNNIINHFDCHFWKNYTFLDHIFLTVECITGNADIKLFHITRNSKQLLEILRVETGLNKESITLSIKDLDGFLFADIISEKSSILTVRYETRDLPYISHPKINYIFCTYQRPIAIHNNVKIINDYIQGIKSEYRPHLTVVDNFGNSAVDQSEYISVFQNRNTGGSGGFGRGMYEACYGSLHHKKFTHICLMDDDIYLDEEMLSRQMSTITYLYPNIHLGSPMYSVFSSDAIYPPFYISSIGHKIEYSVKPADIAIGHNFKSIQIDKFFKFDRNPDVTGWWWNCIAVEDIKKTGMPYPFFMKMDDVNYSLRLKKNDIKLVIPLSFYTLHDEFSVKYTAFQKYYRYRNRLILLALENKLPDPGKIFRTIKREIFIALALRQYESATLLLKGIKDFLKGPENNIGNEEDVSRRTLAVVKCEKNAPLRTPPDDFQKGNKMSCPSKSRIVRLIYSLTAGHFIPWKKKILIDTSQSFFFNDIKQGKEIIFWNSKRHMAFRVQRDSLKALWLVSQLFLLRIFLVRSQKVAREYQKTYCKFTSPEFWKNYGPVSRSPHVPPRVPGASYVSGPEVQDYTFFNAIRNIHLGKRCFIIGNGPSLKMEDLDRLKNEFTFASNKIYLAFKHTNWRPTFYSVEDTLVAENNLYEILNLDCCTKIFPDHMASRIPRYPNVFYTKWIPPANTSLPYRQFSFDLVNGVCWGSTITYTLIQMAVHMGFRELYLIGVDHNYIEPAIKESNTLIASGEQNHFSSEYRKLGEKWHLPKLSTLELSYHAAYRECSSRGIAIYNASRFSKLDAFPRVNFDEIFSDKD